MPHGRMDRGRRIATARGSGRSGVLDDVEEMTLLELIRHPLRGAAMRRSTEVTVRVRGGYHPDVIYATAGDPIRIVFHREETASCSASVVFPNLGRSATLPPRSFSRSRVTSTSRSSCSTSKTHSRMLSRGHRL